MRKWSVYEDDLDPAWQTLLAFSGRSNRRPRRSDGEERVKSYAGKTRGNWGEL